MDRQTKNNAPFLLLFDGYISNSIHVALDVVALTLVTYHYLAIKYSLVLLNFIFFSTIFSYNCTKYYDQFKKLAQAPTRIKWSFFLTMPAGIIAVVCFFMLRWPTQLGALFLGFLNFLYVVPLNKKTKNLRNLAGIKIYIVSICWSGATCMLPFLEVATPIRWDGPTYLWLIERFLFVLILLFVFDVRDLQEDSETLHTIPQQIGIQRTKQWAYLLSLIFCGIQWYLFHSFWVPLLLLILLIISIYFTHPKRSKYYTLFWVESLPICWWILLLIFE